MSATYLYNQTRRALGERPVEGGAEDQSAAMPAPPEIPLAARPVITLRPCGVTVARMGVARCHEHLPVAPPSALAAVEVLRNGWPVGWALLGRPGARMLQAAEGRKGWVEVTRVAMAERGTGAPSRIYSWAAKWARSRKLFALTYTMEHESGASLGASGWLRAGFTRADNRDRRKGRANARLGRKQRWVAPYCRREAQRRGWIR